MLDRAGGEAKQDWFQLETSFNLIPWGTSGAQILSQS